LVVKNEGSDMQAPGETGQRKQWDATYAGKQDFFGTQPSELAISALPTFQKHKVRSILELGCGQGRDTWFLVQNGFQVTALDYAEQGICQMREDAQKSGVQVALQVHDARQPLPFPEWTFDAIYSHMFFTMEFSEEELAFMLKECLRVLRPHGLNLYSVRNDHDPHYGKFTPQGKDMWQNPLGFVVHFFTEEKVRRLSTGYEILWIKEFEDKSPPFVKKLYEVALQKPGKR
jgi:SAM-dependent methyltransferase